MGPELGKRGSYSATFGPHETRTETRTARRRNPLVRWHFRGGSYGLEGCADGQSSGCSSWELIDAGAGWGSLLLAVGPGYAGIATDAVSLRAFRSLAPGARSARVASRSSGAFCDGRRPASGRCTHDQRSSCGRVPRAARFVGLAQHSVNDPGGRSTFRLSAAGDGWIAP